MAEIKLALDRASVRRVDPQSGHLHVSSTPISLSTVNPYRGDEIPEWEKLGLEPDKVYDLYRHPDEMEKAVETFNGKPLLITHKPSNAVNHPHDITVGSINNVTWQSPYLMAGLDIWTKEAIDGIESGDRQQLSCGYGYVPNMTPGVTPDGKKYDGVMTSIHGNHCSLVPEGRAGPTVYVHDAALPEAQPIIPTYKDLFMTAKAVLPRTAASAAALSGALSGALMTYARPKMAADAKLDTLALLRGVTAKNVKAKAPAIAKALDAALKGKLAKDADLDPDEVKDIVEQVAEVMTENSEAIAAEVSPDVDVTDEDDAQLREMLKAKGYTDEEVDAICNKSDTAASAASATDAEKAAEADKAKQATDAKIAAAVRDAKKGMVDATAMDAAISAAVKQATDAATKAQKDIRDAEAHVRPVVGALAMSFDSADGVYRAALKHQGFVEADTLPEAALKPLFAAHVGAKAASQPTVPALAADSATTGKSFTEMFPASTRFTG